MQNPKLVSIAVFGLWLAACTAPTSAPRESSTSAALESIAANDLRAHMQVLATDAMQGRETGTAAFLAAAHYVAERFADAGIAPAGDGNGYLQQVPFLETRLVADSARLSLRREGSEIPLVFAEDFVLAGSFDKVEESVTAPMVFVGFGIEAPEYEHDDYANANVTGRIAVVLTGAPPHFATDQRAFYSSGDGKREAAAGHGAVGILFVRTPTDQQRLPWRRYLSGIGRAELRWIGLDGAASNVFPRLIADGTLSESGAERLFLLAGRDLLQIFESQAAGVVGSFDLGITATVARRSTQRRVVAPNVLGLIRGDDPVLRDEYVIYTAHLDHLGVDGAGEGDRIYNGAYDNAAGVATMLTVAKAIAGMPIPPRRSILFAAVTAEEKGLQGSSYLAENPPVPIERIVANINIDMPFLGFPIADIEGLGVEHSTLADALARACAQVGIALTPDPRPELVRLIRSDQFSFVKQGVPGLNLKPGSVSSDPAIDGGAMLEEFLHHHYHEPSDDLSLPFDNSGAERFARTALMLGLIVANDNQSPRWYDGDFFGERFAALRRR